MKKNTQFEHNLLFSEFDAIKAFGADAEAYWNYDRDLRAAMVGHTLLESIKGAMISYDSHEEAKRKAKHKGKK